MIFYIRFKEFAMKITCCLLFLIVGSISVAQEVAFTLPEKDLIPECVTWSKKQNCYYITSIYRSKIVKYDPATKRSTDFITSGQDGYDGGIGVIIDEKRNILWSASGRRYHNTFFTGIFAWDLVSGKLINKYTIRIDSVPRLFNDLALDKTGNVYVTDTYDSKIYFFNTQLKEPVVFLDDIQYPNGISSGRGKTLFIASHTKGIVKADIRTKSLTWLEPDSNSHTSTGLDGLKYYKKSLMGVFNTARDYADHKLIRYYLGKKNAEITHTKILDAGNPHFKVPTTGVVVRNNYYLLANSNLDLLDQVNHKIPDEEKLTEPVILKYRL